MTICRDFAEFTMPSHCRKALELTSRAEKEDALHIAFSFKTEAGFLRKYQWHLYASPKMTTLVTKEKAGRGKRRGRAPPSLLSRRLCEPGRSRRIMPGTRGFLR
jgi:hypothetical protein